LGKPADDAAVRSIVTQAYLVGRNDPEGFISYSRRKDFYARTRYRGTEFTYTTVTHGIDFLARQGWLQNNTMRPGNRGWQSFFKAEPALMETMNPVEMTLTYEPTETLLLRDRAEGELIDYADTRATFRMRRNLAEINEALASVEIAHPDLGVIRTGDRTRI